GHSCVPPTSATTGHVVTARQAILTVPPAPAVEQIQLTPALPAPLRALAESTPVWMGEMVKAVACYQEPFWSAEGLSGSAISHVGPFRELHDHCGPDGTPAALFAFAPAPSLAGAEREQVAELFTAQLVGLFGDRAREVRSVHVVDWSREQYTQPTSAGTGSPAAFGAPEYQRPVHGRVHWAATETATAYAGHVEGAVRAGLSAARAVETH